MKQLWRFPADEPAPPPKRRRRRKLPLGPALWQFFLRESCSVLAKGLSLVLYLALLFVLAADGEEIWLPELQARLGNRTAEAREGGGEAPEISIGGIGLSYGAEQGAAGVTLNDVEVSQGEMVVHFPKVKTSLGVAAGLQGQLRPKDVRVEGGALRFRRSTEGFAVAAGSDAESFTPLVTGGGVGSGLDVAGLLKVLGMVSGRPMLSELDTVALQDITIALTDQRNGASWATEDARADISRDGNLLRASLRARFGADTEEPMDVAVQMSAPADGEGVSGVRVELENARPADLATQFRALDWMTLLDARATGHLALEFNADGTVAALTGTLSLGAGQVVPPGGGAIGFDGAKGYFSYDPAGDRITVDSLEVATAFGTLTANGSVYLDRGADGAVTVLTAQMQVGDLRLQAPDLPVPLDLGNGTVMARVFVDPFRIEVGRAQFSEGLAALTASGRVRRRDGAWDIALDADVAEVAKARVLEMWPAELRPGVRRWLSNHVRAGLLQNVSAHVRGSGDAPDIAVGFDFADAEVSILHTMPPVTGGAGHIQIAGDRLDLTLTAGRTSGGAASPGAKQIDLAGSRFVIPDFREEPVRGQAELTGRGEIGALLALIDHRPLGILERLGWDADMADGTAEVTARLELPLIQDLLIEDVLYNADAMMTGVRSDALVPGREVASEALALSVTPERAEVSGPIRLSGVPMNIAYRRDLNGNPGGQARVTGDIAVTRPNLAGLGINLPQGSLGGEGRATFTLDLAANAAPAYSVAADLNGATLAVPALGWRKGAGRSAHVNLSGRLGDSPTVESLEFSGPDLAASGVLTLTDDGVAEARFSRLAVGGWLDAPTVWRPGAGGDVVDVAGGTLDLRHLPEFGRGGGSGGQGDDVGLKLTLSPDTVRVTDSIALRGFRGKLTGEDGGRGRFSARINGGTEVTGVVRDGGTIYLQARDGGQALADAGFIDNVRGGTLRVSLEPLAGGVYDGRFSLQEARAVDAPVLANLLAVSNLFGMVDRLAGEGIGFNDAQGWFTLSKDYLTVTRARAVGASLGVTLSGSYEMGRDALNMEGVVTPMYALNSLPARIPLLGKLLGGGRDGEGLLGASFRLTGTAAEPDVAVNPLSLLTPGAARELFMTRPALRPAESPLR
ncbi:AsmA-like C-terminal domain-containing protein [Algicella marina]|uniref:DUF3971 domain-containing protein n=1 Tax=Algicella marina TaxID=2683284 RepID=A0A6P1SY29_9RHOB|nr:AsmA-like C-terminal domain-containing protein [Algicella marina]QHQ34657.1 hypothetical protein GO499_05355 [Algicella marina]